MVDALQKYSPHPSQTRLAAVYCRLRRARPGLDCLVVVSPALTTRRIVLPMLLGALPRTHTVEAL